MSVSFAVSKLCCHHLVHEVAICTSQPLQFCHCHNASPVAALRADNLNGARVAGRIVRVDHVANYKRKKEEDEDEKNAAREERGVSYAYQLAD